MTGCNERLDERTFARFLATPENASALAAIRRVLENTCAERVVAALNPLTVHGPSGTGKSHLVAALVTEFLHCRPDRIVLVIPASEWAVHDEGEPEEAGEVARVARQCDLLVVEDLHLLPGRAAESLVQTVDHLVARRSQVVLTANAGPRHLRNASARLTSRSAGGLLVALRPWRAQGRLAYLEDRAQRRHVAVPREVLAWLAERLTGGCRQLDGALVKLASLARTQPGWLDVPTVAPHFHDEIAASRPTVDRIVERVSGYYRIEPRVLRSARRSRGVTLARHVSIYLARDLTELSLAQIGSYFGRRDHSTVLHACRKVEDALNHDAALSGVVRQLQADLG